MLKLFAILVMTIDHADRVLLDAYFDYEFLTVIGRFAYPVFAFMIARNAMYTRNPRRYLMLLVGFGALSQPIYWWALDHASFWDPLNVMFTLALGVLSVRAWLAGPRFWPALPFIIAAGHFVEYRMEGVALMLAIAFTTYHLRERGWRHWQTLIGAASLIALSFFLNISSYAPGKVLHNPYGPWVVFALLICFATLLPRVEQFETRFRWPGLRLFFYAYYPSHLAILGSLAALT